MGAIDVIREYACQLFYGETCQEHEEQVARQEDQARADTVIDAYADADCLTASELL